MVWELVGKRETMTGQGGVEERTIYTSTLSSAGQLLQKCRVLIERYPAVGGLVEYNGPLGSVAFAVFGY